MPGSTLDDGGEQKCKSAVPSCHNPIELVEDVIASVSYSDSREGLRIRIGVPRKTVPVPRNHWHDAAPQGQEVVRARLDPVRSA